MTEQQNAPKPIIIDSSVSYSDAQVLAGFRELKAGVDDAARVQSHGVAISFAMFKVLFEGFELQPVEAEKIRMAKADVELRGGSHIAIPLVIARRFIEEQRKRFNDLALRIEPQKDAA